MMYNHKLAVALKSAGKVLREFDEAVYIPFGNEYSVLVKNLNSVRALVKIEIDGVDVGDGTKFVVDPNSDVELERFIKNSNYNKGNKFKFIERTGNIEQHRGVGVEDGLVRIEFNFEQQPVVYPNTWIYNTNNDYDKWNKPHKPYEFTCDVHNQNHLVGGSTAAYNVSNNATLTGSITTTSNATVRSAKKSQVDVNLNDTGITVPGSVSDQKFKDADWFPTEAETHVIVLQMFGQTQDNQQVIKPVTVRAKPKCTSCGRTNKATAKFCTECGTSLQIV